MSGERNPARNRNLDEIESMATAAATFWLSDAESAVNSQFGGGYAEKHPAVVAGYVSACAVVYQTERANDAAERIRDGLLAVADALQSAGDPRIGVGAIGIAEELHRLANTAADAFMVLTKPAGKTRSDGERRP